MREIKFRAFDKERQIMDMVEELTFRYDLAGVSYIDLKYTERCLRLCEAELMQYTGLKDKNGVEIYEGDIVEFAYNGLFLKGEVVFSNSGWELKGVDYGEHFRLIEIVHLCEVVGNIYQNEELLK